MNSGHNSLTTACEDAGVLFRPGNRAGAGLKYRSRIDYRMTLMRFGNLALLILDLHLFALSLLLLNPPVRQMAATTLGALILFTMLVIVITPKK